MPPRALAVVPVLASNPVALVDVGAVRGTHLVITLAGLAKVELDAVARTRRLILLQAIGLAALQRHCRNGALASALRGRRGTLALPLRSLLLRHGG